MNRETFIKRSVFIATLITLIFTFPITRKVSAYSVCKQQNQDGEPPPVPIVEFLPSEGTMDALDSTDPDCTPGSDETPAVVDGNLFTLEEGHYYCKQEGGTSICYVWDGEQLQESWPTHSACVSSSESWCHLFTDVHNHPCTELALTAAGQVVCLGPETISVSAQVPCPIVQRWPYPRGLVDLENSFTVLGPWKSDTGRAFRASWIPGVMRNYLLEIEWRYNESSYPVWFFDEREWAEEPAYASGFSVSHTYQTSSSAKPDNGPSLEGRLDLPAYQVRVYAQWVPWVHRKFEYTAKKRIRFVCSNGDIDCINRKIQCELTGYDNHDPDCFRTTWETYDSGWVPIDLRLYGGGHYYYTSAAAVDITQPPGDIPAVPDAARVCDTIPVPVVEVQVYLNAP